MTDSTPFAALAARALRTRWLVRAPIVLYRAGLGFLFGTRLLMLQHTGRHSGAARFVVLEVVDHPEADQYIVVSGFGVQAQWYRNVQCNPQVRVSIGTARSLPATAVAMTPEESAIALDRYIREHPKAWDKLRAAIEHATGKPADDLPMVRLSLHARADHS
ncbi:nitroreductase family deazaflavin-dependent oxidoreductase [Nocardia gamkensis]|uniref:nitroreductase family deazaflavin-dependent oxidoreductase n=1 Tax=Nocardia gamkensis TaxID=352869 RepID=UPI0037C69CCE